MAPQKVFLISPRRYGKSSLVRQALRAAARGGALTLEVMVSSDGSDVAFLEGYARALAAAETRVDRVRAWLSEMLAGVRSEVRLERDATGRSQIAVSFPAARTDRDVSHLAQQVFALPGKIAEARRRRMAIALDEFQGIAAFNGGSVEHALRAAVQQPSQVGYVFAGSEPTLMERMLGKSRPFHKAGLVMREHESLFERTWRRLTLAQRGALWAAVLEDGRELLSADVRARHRLSGTSTVQASLAALVRDDVLTRDVGSTRWWTLFGEWVARRTS